MSAGLSFAECLKAIAEDDTLFMERGSGTAMLFEGGELVTPKGKWRVVTKEDVESEGWKVRKRYLYGIGGWDHAGTDW